MKDDFPAEWLPMSMMVIFLRGARRVRSRFLAIETRPLSLSV